MRSGLSGLGGQVLARFFPTKKCVQCACLGCSDSIKCASHPSQPFTVSSLDRESHEDRAVMDGQVASVRRNIALKLRGDPSTTQKVQQPEPKKGKHDVLIDAHLHQAHVTILYDCRGHHRHYWH